MHRTPSKTPFGVLLMITFSCQFHDLQAQRRPLLFANPENPGPHPLAEVRQQMIARFDQDQDGFLDHSERNTMRLATKRAGEERMNAVLATRKRREEVNRPPERWLALYDKDKNKRFSGGEWEKARDAEIARVTAQFDTNNDNQLSHEERKSVAQFMRQKKHNGYDSYILRIVSGEDQRERGRRISSEDRWRRFDTDGDGIASRDELKAIRENER